MTAAPKLREVVAQAAAAFARRPAGHLKDLMQDEGAPATALLRAAGALLGPTFRAWEPETLWKELDPLPGNRDKLMAAIALDVNPSFFWDFRALGATALAFNDDAVHHDHVPHPTAAQLAWGVFEAELIFALTDDSKTHPEFDDEGAAFVAACLYDQGLVLAPEQLTFAQGALDELLNPEAKELKDKVQPAWQARSKDEPFRIPAESSPFSVQLARQAEVSLYLVNRGDNLIRYLDRL